MIKGIESLERVGQGLPLSTVFVHFQVIHTSWATTWASQQATSVEDWTMKNSSSQFKGKYKKALVPPPGRFPELAFSCKDLNISYLALPYLGRLRRLSSCLIENLEVCYINQACPPLLLLTSGKAPMTCLYLKVCLPTRFACFHYAVDPPIAAGTTPHHIQPHPYPRSNIVNSHRSYVMITYLLECFESSTPMSWVSFQKRTSQALER